MVVRCLTITFWTVFAGLGFSVIFNLFENIGKRYASKRHLLGTFAQEVPLIIAVSALMLLMRVMNIAAHDASIDQYWLLINIQLLMMIYTDLMSKSVGTFLITKVFAAISLAGTGGMTIVAWAIFVIAGLAVFTESHYSRTWSQSSPVLFALPPIVIDTLFWALMYVAWRPALTIIIPNYIGFIVAVTALFINSRTQRADQQIIRRLTHQTQFDALTSVRNWAMFQQDFTQAFTNVKTDWPLGIMALDLDNFKSINDTYGHLAGNEALTTAAGTLEQALQALDPDYHLYRTGGEEFAIILPHTDCITAKKIGLQCLNAIRGLSINLSSGHTLALTASFGLTQALDKDRDATAVFKRADNALYLSKRAGRDRLTINEETLAS